MLQLRLSVQRQGHAALTLARFTRRSSMIAPEPTLSAQEMAQRASEDPLLLESFLQQLPKEHQKVLHSRLHAATVVSVPEPPLQELKALAFSTSIPFVGFGIMDNAILIIAGDAIDTSLGVTLGISTMCAAAIGNIISDVSGIALGTVVEDFCANVLKLPAPNLTAAQRNLRSARLANQFGCAVGIVIGCIIGMFPLLFYDNNKLQSRKRQAALDNIFRDIVKDAGGLIGAQRMSLFILVDDTTPGKNPAPTPDGRYLFAKYDNNSRLIPLGRGLVSRAALTGETWNIYDVHSEPEYTPEEMDTEDDVRNMLCVPVLDNTGRPIAVLQAINKKMPPNKKAKKRTGFTSTDVQILKALASHISVSLQRMNDGENDDMQMRDTIRMLRDYGLEGIPAEQSTVKRTPLFPE